MAALRAKAADMNAIATADQIKLAVDEAFYNALQTLAVQKVAEQTVNARQLVSDQITTLFQNKLRSRSWMSALPTRTWRRPSCCCWTRRTTTRPRCRTLSQVLGYTGQQPFDLVDTETALKPPPDAVSQLEDQAFSNRPEIASQNYEYQAAQHFQKAERDLLFPTVEAWVSWAYALQQHHRTECSRFTTWYGAIGVNVNVPIFNGFLYSGALARSRTARPGRQSATARFERPHRQRRSHQLAECHHRVRPYRRLATVCRPDQARPRLSQTRYNLGLSSIVELSQAQLQQTEAQIQFAAAKYQYQIAESVLRFQIAAP